MTEQTFPEDLADRTYTVVTADGPSTEEIIAELQLDSVNPALTRPRPFSRPGLEYVVAPVADLRLLELDDWVQEEVGPMLRELGGFGVDPYQMLRLVQGNPRLLFRFPMMVALSGEILNRKGEECYVNFWFNQRKGIVGLGLVRVTQEWHPGVCIPYQLNDSFRREV